jgi:hypothetical protein
LRIHEEPVEGADGSVRIVCEGGDAAAVAAAAQEAAARYARQHGAVALDPGFFETDVPRLSLSLLLSSQRFIVLAQGRAY